MWWRSGKEKPRSPARGAGPAEASAAGKRRYRIRFHGRVQGVGFRYTAQQIARGLGLTGWVRNEWDGTVLMEAQGEEEAVLEMLDRLDGGRFIRIDSTDREEIPPEAAERSFRIEEEF